MWGFSQSRGEEDVMVLILLNILCLREYDVSISIPTKPLSLGGGSEGEEESLYLVTHMYMYTYTYSRSYILRETDSMVHRLKVKDQNIPIHIMTTDIISFHLFSFLPFLPLF